MSAAPDALTFRCTGCGNCCRALRVAVTAADVARLALATGRKPSALVAWLAPDEVDMQGEPESFVELRAGRRLMVLAHERGQGCALLTADNRCSAYAARPLDCRAFPFDFGVRGGPEPAASRPALLPLIALRRGEAGALLDCDYASDGEQDALALDAQDAQRWAELAEFQRVVARWNRLVSHRRRLRHTLGSAEDFLRFALDACAPSERERDALTIR